MLQRQVLGIAKGEVVNDTKAIQFSFTVKNHGPMPFIMEFGAAAQVIGALGRMFSTAQELAQAEKGMISVAAEQVGAAQIQHERWTGNILLQLTTPLGVPYTFVLPPSAAADIAERLKIESAKPHQTGSA